MAIRRGQHFIVRRSGAIEAASGVFDYEQNLPYVELSETRVLAPLRGFGLQRTFLRLRIASVVVYQGPSVLITTAVDPGNPHSIRNVTTHGFEPWLSPIDAAFASCPQCPHKPAAVRRCCCDFYLLPIDRARAAVRELLAQTRAGEIRLMNTRQELLTLECHGCRIATDSEMRAALQDFAERGSW